MILQAAKISLLALKLLICVSSSFAADDQLLLETSTGWIQGKNEVSRSGKPVLSFLGIPYATPPLGNLRFKPPLPITPWEGVLQVTALPNTCFQRTHNLLYRIPILKRLAPLTSFSEDCLKLNVWVPSTTSKNTSTIVFIHGGAYSGGSSASPITLGDVLSTEEEIIVVTMNYRVASLGFLFLGDEGAPGNAGLYDQRLALEWIHQNIKVFGGDPEKVTLYGQSAGSSSILFHLLSGKSDHVFQRIIVSSPPQLAFMVLDYETSFEKSLQLVENVGCASKTSNRSEMISCLRNIDPEDIIKSEPTTEYNFLVFYPIEDDDAVVRDASKKLSERKFKPVDVLIGSNRDEATILLMLLNPYVYQPTQDKVKPAREDFREILRYYGLTDIMIKVIEFYYTNRFDLDKSEITRLAVEESISDCLFSCPINRYTDHLSGSGKAVYRYFFDHFSEGIKAPRWLGVFHALDVFYALGEVFVTEKLPTDRNMAKRFMRYWASFARTGNPNENPDGTRTSVAWPAYSPLDQDFFILSPNSTSVGKKLRASHCVFWDYFLPLLAKEVHVPQRSIRRILES